MIADAFQTEQSPAADSFLHRGEQVDRTSLSEL
jgi:hypothetical protein